MDVTINWPDEVRKERPLFNAVLDEHTLFVEDPGNPVVEIVTLAEVKTWLKIDGSFNDSLLEMLIPMCRAELEKEVQRSLIERTVTTALRYEVGDSGMAIPFGPILDFLDATDADGNTLNLTIDFELQVRGNDFFLMTHHSFISLEFNTTPDDDPRLKKRLLEKIAHAFYNRGDK